MLAAAVRLLPSERHQWGMAMRAELAGIDEGRQRWRFTLGCVRVVATRSALWRRVGYCLLSLAVLAAAVRGTARVWYTSLHAELIGMVAILVLVAWWGLDARSARLVWTIPSQVPEARSWRRCAWCTWSDFRR